MSPDHPDVMPPEASSPAPETETAADAPAPARRPRAPRKTASGGAAEAAEQAPVAAAVEAPPAEPAAPRRRTRKPAALEVTQEGTQEATRETSHEGPEAFDASPGMRPTVDAVSAGGAVQEDAARAPQDVVATGQPRAAGDAASSQAHEGAPDGGDTGEGVAGESEGDAESRRSRSRRRRRGRRGGEDEASAAPASETDGEGAGDTDGDEGAGTGGPRTPRLPRPVIEFAEDAGETFAGVLSGTFDADAEVVEGQSAIPAKRVLAAEPDAPKLHKVLAQSGIGSRRDMEQLIADGKVTVNGEAAHTGQRISFGDEVRVAGRVVKLRIAPPPARVIAYHKPVGEVVTMDDPEKRPTVFRRLPRLPHGKWQSVGRLDINTEGLLLFTNSGDLANKLMHPRFGVEREYAVRVLGTLDEETSRKLLEGVSIEGQPAQFKSIEDGGGEGANHWYRVVITEGRNREVRKLFDAVGMAVSRLIRIRYGSVVLPKGLKRGVWVDLDEGDVRKLRHLAGAGAEAPRAPDHRAERGPRPESPPQQPRGNGPGAGQGPRPQQQQQQQRGNGRGRDRVERNDRGERPDRADRGDRGQNPAPFREPGDPSYIPNPLQQTFDRRAIQQRERPISVADEVDEENGPIGPIPNPLQQTYDKRFVQGNRSPFGSKGGKGGAKGGAAPGGQPDPLQTAVGYIGADAFVKKMHGRGGRGRR